MSVSPSANIVLVVGGGIGGLTTALALSRKGIPVRVLEQAAEFKEIGAGIQLGPNVFRMFELLGLTEAIFRWAAFPDALEMRDAMTGETVVEMRIDNLYDRYRAPYGVIHRADLLNQIHDACGASNLIELLPSRKVVSIEDNGDNVAVHTDTGETFKGAALVGCDGLWSTVRAHIINDGKPVVSGHIAYRAVLPTAQWPQEYRLPRMIVWAGNKTHLVHYPLRRGELFNLVVVFHSDRYQEGWDSYGDPAELYERFAEKCEPVRTLLKKVDSWRMWVLCDRPPIKYWSKGRITLLGDAAHPMLQIWHKAPAWLLRMRSALPTRSQPVAVIIERPLRDMRSYAIYALRACRSWRASTVRCITLTTSFASFATRSCASGRHRAGSTCPGSMATNLNCLMSIKCGTLRPGCFDTIWAVNLCYARGPGCSGAIALGQKWWRAAR